MVTMQSFLQTAHDEGSHISPLFRIPGLRIEHCKPDFMHVVCLGTLQYAQGNTVWEVFKHVWGLIPIASHSLPAHHEHDDSCLQEVAQRQAF